MNKLFGILLTTTILALPVVAANHGLVGQIVATLDDGSVALADIGYVTGNFNSQTWSFAWTTSSGGALNCNGFGSLEIGFTGIGCAFATGGTGDSHTYPYGQLDVHEITVSLNGVGGTGQQVVCPDTGALSAGCGTALGTL